MVVVEICKCGFVIEGTAASTGYGAAAGIGASVI